MCPEGPPGVGEHRLGHQADPVAPLDARGDPQFANAGSLPGCPADPQGEGESLPPPCSIYRNPFCWIQSVHEVGIPEICLSHTFPSWRGRETGHRAMGGVEPGGAASFQAPWLIQWPASSAPRPPQSVKRSPKPRPHLAQLFRLRSCRENPAHRGITLSLDVSPLEGSLLSEKATHCFCFLCGGTSRACH